MATFGADPVSWCGTLCKVKANKGCTIRADHTLDSAVVGELPFSPCGTPRASVPRLAEPRLRVVAAAPP